ncbi:ketosteroid isomerase-like protein [Actinoplanes lutulentus]|uniref:SnoaL-like domain-containing protein n=1 Tax=Actinoplanes lutulentus TaxID=1287878 RepID=A0A327YXK5_9ACTN|nr:nuclear transport factor 2 family protein [Actinoplanes lutulentus]MBB2946507.1 ketosteroid isomerase-like protein [Actinoplanes lutulentus]RAK26425.1 hypothetical protein B0I29_12715 [Actinoplanes lutulentus]
MSSLREENLAVLRGYFDAMRAGGPPAAMPFYAGDVVLEVPGAHPASGTYRGHAGVGEFGATMARLTGGTFRLTPDELLAGDDHVVTVATASANGVSWRRLILATVRDGQLATLRFFEGDQDLVDTVLTP